MNNCQVKTSLSSCCNPSWNPDDHAGIGVRNDNYEVQDLAKEMAELTAEEREKVMDDIHAVAQVQEETPEFIQKCLEDFDTSIVEIPLKHRPALIRAWFLRPTLQTDTKLKLMFLRCDRYDTKKASRRMVQYFEQKRVLFGEEKLVKRITIDDLSPQDMEVFYSGCTRRLNSNDQAGRPVFFYDGDKIDLSRIPAESYIRCSWYQNMASFLADEVIQRKGASAIQYFGNHDIPVRQVADFFLLSGSTLNRCLPCRFSSFHICFKNPRMDFFVRTIRMAFDRDARLRVRGHVGSDVENEYNMLTFGIQCDQLLQRSQDGNSKVIEEYVMSRQSIDRKEDEDERALEAQSRIVAYPNPNDVIVGRGLPFREYSGNMQWTRLLSTHLTRYQEGSTFEKTIISMDVVKTVKESGSRFLQRTPKGWKILDDVTAKDKTSCAFRKRVQLAAFPPLVHDTTSIASSKRPRCGLDT